MATFEQKDLDVFAVRCTTEERVTVEMYKARLQMRVGKKRTMLQTIMYLFHEFEKEYEILDAVRQDILPLLDKKETETSEEVSQTDNERILHYLIEEHKLLDVVRKQIVAGFQGDTSAIDNEYIIRYLFVEYMNNKEKEQSQHQPDTECT